jgi:uncharacterized protein YgiM (DUF1202 family)
MRNLGLVIAATLLAVAWVPAWAAEDAAGDAEDTAGDAEDTEQATESSDTEATASSTVEARTGEINVHDINVRAGAHLNYEILTQLDKGDLVLVKQTRGDWTRIAMPPGVLAWVSSRYVADDGVVEGEHVNVRSGPGLKYNLLCQLKRDDQVVIKETSEDRAWYGIAPPEAAGAWVYAKYVTDKGPASLYAEWAPRKAKCVALLASADRLRTYELKRPEAEIRFDAILANYRRIESDYADMPEARTAKHRIRELERIKADVTERLAARGSTTSADTEATEKTTSETQTNAATEQEEQPEAKYLTARGVLREISRESTSKGLYRITREDRWICIVKSGTLDLGAYAGKSVQVWGLEAPSEGWSLRTINVSRVKLLE